MNAIKKHTQNLGRERGFTLIELIVYMGIMSVLLIIFTNIFTTLIDTQLNAQTTSYVAQDGRYMYSKLIYDINSADSVQTPTNLGDASASLVITNDGQSVTYELSGDTLTMTDTTGSYAMNSIGTKISELSFQRIGNADDSACPNNTCKDTFRINFTIAADRDADSSPEVREFQTTAGLR